MLYNFILDVVCCEQKALKEKEEHIEQLLRERDLERSEVARAAAQVDEVSLLFISIIAVLKPRSNFKMVVAKELWLSKQQQDNYSSTTKAL